MVNHWLKKTPLKQPKCKSFAALKAYVDDPLIVAKLNYFSFIAGLLTPYLTRYQSQNQ